MRPSEPTPFARDSTAGREVDEVVVLCPHPQMRPGIERSLRRCGCRVRMVTDVTSFRATVLLTPARAPALLVALGRDDLLAALLDELAENGRAVAMIRSPRTPRALAEHPRVGTTLMIPYDDAQLADFSRRLARGGRDAAARG